MFNRLFPLIPDTGPYVIIALRRCAGADFKDNLVIIGEFGITDGNRTLTVIVTDSHTDKVGARLGDLRNISDSNSSGNTGAQFAICFTQIGRNLI